MHSQDSTLPNRQDIARLLDYNPDAGVFTWKSARQRIKVGQRAGVINNNGYRVIGVNQKQYLASRLAWLLTYKENPDGQIDHINHVRDDDRIENLRVVTHQENHQNQSLSKNNTSGVTGVYWQKSSQRWYSRICIDGKNISLYTGHEFFEAVCARKSADIRYGFHKNHGAN